MSDKPFIYRRKKNCDFCIDEIYYIDYKDLDTLNDFIPRGGKVLPSRITGTCRMHQKQLMTAITRARELALLPYKID